MLLSRNLIKVLTKSATRTSYIRVRSDSLQNLFIQQPEVIKWEAIRKDIIDNDRTINKTNIDGVIISKCFNGARLDIAKSYLDYMNSNQIQISDAFILKLIRLYYSRYRMYKEEFTELDAKEVLGWCKHIINKFDYLDHSTAENIIHGLSLTSEWREAEKYFEMMGEKTIDRSTYSAFISKAIAEGDYRIVWKYLKRFAENFEVPRSYIFIEWFEKHADDKEKIEEMLEFIGENGILLPEADINAISVILSKSYSCSLVGINRKGSCPSCKSTLPGVRLMDSEFQKMAKRFLDDIIIKSDVFIKTNPAELDRFKKFVDKFAPFDCVIDGLNVAYSNGTKLNAKVYSKILAQVVKSFADRKEKCLVIGRKHMDSWPRKEMSFIKQNSHLFLMDDLSNDDLFLLYAALKSGPKTNIFTRDLLRQHSHLLGQKMRKTFRRWQQEHQFTLVTVSQKVIVKEPIVFELKAHKVNSRWHIPFTNENVLNSTQTFELPSKWICLQDKMSYD